MLEQAITQWDGKSSEDIGKIYQQYVDDALTTQLLPLMKIVQLQNGATWLLKKHLEGGAKLTSSEQQALLELLPELNHWQSCLHLLQIFHYLAIGEQFKQSVEGFLRRCLADDNKFVRAWSYHGWYHLQAQYPQYATEVKDFFSLAMKDEAASVKARIRNIAKAYQFEF